VGARGGRRAIGDVGGVEEGSRRVPFLGADLGEEAVSPQGSVEGLG
jgi:hypothetical protein